MTKPMDKWCCLGCDKLGKFIHKGSPRTPRAALHIWHLLPPHCKDPLWDSVSQSRFRAQMLNLKSKNILLQQLQISEFLFLKNSKVITVPETQPGRNQEVLCSGNGIFYTEGACNRMELMENNETRTYWSCTRTHHLDTGHRWGPKGLIREESQIWTWALIQKCIWGLLSETR